MLPLLDAAFHRRREAELVEAGRAKAPDHVADDAVNVIHRGEHPLRPASLAFAILFEHFGEPGLRRLPRLQLHERGVSSMMHPGLKLTDA